jgi:hypothetical protein
LETFTGEHVLHVDDLSAVIVFNEQKASGAASLLGYATLIAKHVDGKRLGKDKRIADGPWGFVKQASVVNQVREFHQQTGIKASEIHVVSHTNNGLDFQSPTESETLAPHVIEDVKIVWHGCYACNFFSDARKKAVFTNLPHASVYGHSRISVQAGMPWAFIRIRESGEVDIDRVIPEVLPRGYVVEWAKNEPDEHLQKTVDNGKAEEDVKTIVRAEQQKRKP